MSHFLSNLTIGQPWFLAWSLLALVPLMMKGYPAFPYPSIARLPVDTLSIWVERLWRLSGALAIVFIAMALAGIYWADNVVERVGRGAHVMIVLDRSASMNDDFADPPAGERESKMAAARRVLQTFVSQGKEDLLGMVTFSTSPILVAPLGGDREAVLAALRATEAGGMGFTAVARGLGMALDYFEGRPVTGSRVILLVSDGGAYLDVKTQDMLRNMVQRQGASLFWIYLRSANGASLKVTPEAGDEDAYPEYQLHRYFATLGMPYRAYEADNPLAVERAMADIARLKNQPVRYYESAPRRDLSWLFYLLALLSACVVFALHMTEVKRWRSA
ncbi:MAG: VWA domain-containing protein [Betaproteobacteria bacterium HGW-Betaproteobacteria-8]|nr:MAG: VWA domain-containing protein [Betaproteobacteria bacterium HGW-Betaproteobacteria-8]